MDLWTRYPKTLPGRGGHALAPELAMVVLLSSNAAAEEVPLEAELQAKVLELECSSSALERESHLPLPLLLLPQQLLQQLFGSWPLAQQRSACVACLAVAPSSSEGAFNDACLPLGA